MLKSERKKLIRDAIEHVEPAYHEGVIIGIDNRLSPDEQKESMDYAIAQINDPNSEFSQRRAAAKARRAAFDKRLADSREVVAQEVGRAANKEGSNNGKKP